MPSERLETYTELDVDERRDLLEDIEAIKPGDHVRLRWPSSRSSNVVEAEGVVRPSEDTPLYVRCRDRTGDIYVNVRNLENIHYAGIVAKSTGSRHSGREPTLGELLSVEVIDDAE